MKTFSRRPLFGDADRPNQSACSRKVRSLLYTRVFSTTYGMVERFGAFFLYLAALATIAVCISNFGWTRTWSALNIPTMSPPFADLRVFQGAVISAAQGHDPQLANPADPWQRQLNHPRSTIAIANLLRLQDEARFRLAAEIMIMCFVAVCAFIIVCFPSYLLLAFMLSSSVLLGIERANDDLLIFCLVFLYLLALRKPVSPIPLLAATALKLFPVFALTALLIRRQFFLFAASSIAAILILWHLFDQLGTIVDATQKGAVVSYGFPSLLLYFRREHMPLWLFAIAVAAMAVAVVGLILFFRRVMRNADGRGGLSFNLFVGGASIYVGTFIFSTNWDYRLIFLVFCIPYLQIVPFRLAGTLLTTMFLAMNELPLHMLFGANGNQLNWVAKTGLFVAFSAWLLALGLDVLPRRISTADEIRFRRTPRFSQAIIRKAWPHHRATSSHVITRCSARDRQDRRVAGLMGVYDALHRSGGWQGWRLWRCSA